MTFSPSEMLAATPAQKRTFGVGCRWHREREVVFLMWGCACRRHLRCPPQRTGTSARPARTGSFRTTYTNWTLLGRPWADLSRQKAALAQVATRAHHRSVIGKGGARWHSPVV